MRGVPRERRASSLAPSAVGGAAAQAQVPVEAVEPHSDRGRAHAPSALGMDHGQVGARLLAPGRLEGRQRLPEGRVHGDGPATPGPLAARVGEGDLLSVDLYGRVRRACHVDGMSIREAARVLGLHRETVSSELC